MKTPVKITLSGRQTIGSDSLYHTVNASGDLFEKSGDFYVVYKPEEKGEENFLSSLKFTSNMVLLTKFSTPPSNLIFKQGERKNCSYSTPYGQLGIDVDCNFLNGHMDESGGKVNIEYSLLSNGLQISSHELSIFVEKL